MNEFVQRKGGPGDPGSGHHGHAGRLGEIGGSVPAGISIAFHGEFIHGDADKSTKQVEKYKDAIEDELGYWPEVVVGSERGIGGGIQGGYKPDTKIVYLKSNEPYGEATEDTIPHEVGHAWEDARLGSAWSSGDITKCPEKLRGPVQKLAQAIAKNPDYLEWVRKARSSEAAGGKQSQKVYKQWIKPGETFAMVFAQHFRRQFGTPATEKFLRDFGEIDDALISLFRAAK